MFFKHTMSAKSKVLFFISGPVPSDAQQAQADEITTTKRAVMFRNALQVGPNDCLERADYVCGEVPPRYSVKTASFNPPEVIQLDQPELPLETTPATPMAAVSVAPVAIAAPVIVPSEPTEADVKAFSALNIDAVLAKVKAGELTREAAVKLEQLGKGRKSLLSRLTEAVD